MQCPDECGNNAGARQCQGPAIGRWKVLPTSQSIGRSPVVMLRLLMSWQQSIRVEPDDEQSPFSASRWAQRWARAGVVEQPCPKIIDHYRPRKESSRAAARR